MRSPISAFAWTVEASRTVTRIRTFLFIECAPNEPEKCRQGVRSLKMASCLRWFDVRFGSFSEIGGSRREVRFAPNSGHHRVALACRFRANRRHRICVLKCKRPPTEACLLYT